VSEKGFEMKGIADKIVEKKIEEIVPYENNPRNNDKAVKFVANSIKQFGFKVPIIIDKNGVIVAGHTRLKAAKKLGMKMVPCIVADDLTPEQVKAFRLADNKTAELADWNDELLESELADIDDIDMGQFGFEGLENLGEEEKDDTYTTAINIPQYDITGDKTEMGGVLRQHQDGCPGGKN
jgi:ParB-like chromosome segregation protein Spo0J